MATITTIQSTDVVGESRAVINTNFGNLNTEVGAATTHAANTSNPHSVTKDQVGLGNVDNTADTAKPVSTAQQTALDLKANLASPTLVTPNIGTPSAGTLTNCTGLPQSGVVDLTTDLSGKQATLVSGTNIKTINSTSLLGSGNIEIEAGEATPETISQEAHGFVAGQPVFNNGTTWVAATSDDVATAACTGIVESVTTDTFVVVREGPITLTGVAAGSIYYVATSGTALTTTAPTASGTCVTLVMRGEGTDLGYVDIQPPVLNALVTPEEIDIDALQAALDIPAEVTLPAQVSTGEITAGTETGARLWSPADVVSAIDQHAPEGGGTAEFFTGFTALIPDGQSVPTGWSLTGVNGIPALTTPDADYKAIVKHAGTVAAPTFSPVAGELAFGGESVTISTATSGATIKYTTDGGTPSRTNGTEYSSPVSVTTAQTVKAIAYKDYSVDSSVSEAAYTIASAGFEARGAVFDGTNDAIRITGTTLTGTATGGAFTLGFSIKTASDGGSNMGIFTISSGTASNRLRVFRNTSNQIEVTGQSSGGTVRLAFVSSQTFLAGVEKHVLIVVNLAGSGVQKFYVNGVHDSGGTWTTFTADSTLDLAPSVNPRCTIGGNAADTPITLLNATLKELWFDDTAVDSIGSFYSGGMVSLGDKGQTPLGGSTQPVLYLGAGNGNSWAEDRTDNNNDFTVIGSLGTPS